MTRSYEILLTDYQYSKFIGILESIKEGIIADCAPWACRSCVELFKREYAVCSDTHVYNRCPCHMFSKRLLKHRVRQLLKFNREVSRCEEL